MAGKFSRSIGFTAAIAVVAFGVLFFRMALTPPHPGVGGAPGPTRPMPDPRRSGPPGGGPVGPGEDYLRGTLVAMGGVQVVVTVFGEDSVERFRLHLDAVAQLIDRLEDQLSGYRADSPVSRLNRGAGETILTPGPEFLEVLGAGLELHRRTGGAYDMTVWPLMGLWRRAAQRGSVPTAAELDDTLARIGPDRIEFDETRGTVRLSRPGMGLDFGGLAKGYIVDRAVELLRDRGVVKAMVNAGGDLRAFAPSGALPLRIGIRDPEGGPDQILGVFEIRDAAVATSGNYENYVEIDGRRFGHILDPRTGRPAEGALSATVRAPTTMLADGLATAVFVLGPAQGMGLVEETDGVEAILLYRDRGGVQRLKSSGMDRIDWLDPVAPP